MLTNEPIIRWIYNIFFFKSIFWHELLPAQFDNAILGLAGISSAQLIERRLNKSKKRGNQEFFSSGISNPRQSEKIRQ
jgi:hypothetical protein